MSHKDEIGVIYLLHFNTPLAHAKHYMGWTADLNARLGAHANGTGARLTAAVARTGRLWVVARTWEGTKTRERQLKRQGGRTRLCPICRGQTPVEALA